MTRAVLFDLDGTFADTAPDLGRAVNSMRAARGLGPVPLSETRRVTSLGARGLLGVGFGMTPDHPDYAAMRDEFLQIYESNLCCDTRLFPGIAELVDHLEAGKSPWGIVTNKAERFAHHRIVSTSEMTNEISWPARRLECAPWQYASVISTAATPTNGMQISL